MAKHESIAWHTSLIEVIGKCGASEGRLELGADTLNYYRPSARSPALKLTYPQLVGLLEREVSYQRIDEQAFHLPRQHKDGDFILSVSEIEIDESLVPLVQSVTRLKKLDARRIDLGAYQFSQDMQSGRKPKHVTWFAQLSIQAALWVVHRYVEKFLVGGKSSTYTDADVQISKQEMRELLLGLYKRIS